MDFFKYVIHRNDCVNKCMISAVKEIAYQSKPAPYPASCHVNQLWSEVISPTRTQFLLDGTFARETLPEMVCDRVYFPFEAEKIEYSGFWMQPHALYFAAQMNLLAPQAGEYSFLLSTCGGAKVFVNGLLQAEMYPYLRNQETSQPVTLRLVEGDNKIYILANDLAERDTQFYCKLRYTGEPDLQGYLPVNTEMKRLERIRDILSKMYLERFNFQNNDISLFFDRPLEEAFDARITLIFTDAHTKTEQKRKTVSLCLGDTKVFIGDLVYKKVGMVSVTVQVRIGDLKIDRRIDFEYYDQSVMPTCGLGTIKARKQAALLFAAEYGLNNFQKALALAETGLYAELASEIVEQELYRLNERYDCSDFRIPALVYAYGLAGFSQEQKNRIKTTLLNFRYWFDEDGSDVMWFFSENHALNFHASELLAGELFPDALFPNSGMTGVEHQKKAKQLLLGWFDNFFAYGFNEWNSAVYIPIDMIAFFALYDLAQDTQIRELARRALDKTFGILSTNSYQGIVAASYGRIYFKNLIGRRTSESSALNLIAGGSGFFNQHCFATTLFALSAYEPPAEVLKGYNPVPQGQETLCSEGEEQVQLYSFKTPDYIMGSVLNYRPGQCGVQEHVLQLMIKDCDTQIWINHPGEANYFGEGRPSYFAGNGTLPLVEQNRNVARVTFKLLEQEVQYTHAFCPLAQFDCYRLLDRWLFLKKQDVCVAIYADNGLQITRDGALKDYELVSYGRNNFWEVVVERESAFEDFETFIRKISQKY